jgi:5-methyltetrahydropteroyltriglutamate--homocysteine methyltransferase
MKRSTERILTTHTGSLPRPPDVLELLYGIDDGTAEAGELDRCLPGAIGEVVRRQVEAGIDVVNDGELSKLSYSTYVRNRLSGFEGVDSSISEAPNELAEFPGLIERWQQFNRRVRVHRPACNGPVALRDPEAVDKDIANLKAAASGTPAAETFMTAASPGIISMYFKNTYYPSREAYLGAIADAMQAEYESIAASGVVLQVDCPDLSGGGYRGVGRQGMRREVALNVEALNHATRNIDPDRMRIHLCWGNMEAPHHWDPPLRDIVDIVLTIRAHGLSLEAANPRHEHEWQVFEDVKLPDGKLLIPGVLDSTTNYIEHPELVAQRLLRYAELVGRENVMAGTDCGFATLAESPDVFPSIVWPKLAAMAEGSQLASRRLWG